MAQFKLNTKQKKYLINYLLAWPAKRKDAPEDMWPEPEDVDYDAIRSAIDRFVDQLRKQALEQL